MELVKGDSSQLPVAACVSMLDEKGQIKVHCLNPTDQPLQENAGTVLGSYTVVDKANIQTENMNPKP